MITPLRIITFTMFICLLQITGVYAAVGVNKHRQSEDDPFAKRTVSTKPKQKKANIGTQNSDSTNRRRLPLAVLSGTFLAKENRINVPISLSVVDKISKQSQHFVFDPDPTTGEYRIFVPQNRTYEIHIEPQGYKAHVVQVYVPEYTYSYEFSRELKLEYISVDDKIIGKRILVANSKHNFIKVTDVNTQTDIYYDPLVALSETIFDRGEIEKLYALHHLAKTPINSTLDENIDTNFDEMFANIDSAISTGNMSYINRMREDAQLFHESFYGMDNLQGKEVFRTEFLYQKNQYELIGEHQKNLDQLLSLLKSQENLLVKIEGFADSDGSENINKEISYKRALGVLRYLKAQHLDSKFIVEGLGVSKDSTEKQKNRRVDLVVFKLPNN